MSLIETTVLGFGLGIVSSLHCSAMCGVFALRAAAATSSFRALSGFGLYLLGKTFTYLFLGAIVGYAGMESLAGATAWRDWIAAAAALLLILWGLASLSPRPSRLASSNFALRFISPLMRGLGEQPSRFALGALTGFLPCGLLYLALIQAGTRASVLESIIFMISFGLATGPSLLIVGLLGRHCGKRTRLGPVGLRLASSVILIAMGMVALWRALLPIMSDTGAVSCCH